MKTIEQWKEECTCGDFKPYEPEGIVAALQPFGSCIGCYLFTLDLGSCVVGCLEEAVKHWNTTNTVEEEEKYLTLKD